MKKNFFTSAILVLAMSFMVGCSSDDSTPGNEVEDPKGQLFKQKILVEDITSASCVWCPLASFTTEELAKSEYDDRIISVAVHGDFNTQLVKDPFVLPGMTKLMSAVELGGWPFVAWNRDLDIKGTEFQGFIPKRKNESGEIQYTFDANLFKNFYTKYSLFSESSPIGIKIESDLTVSGGKVDVSLKFGQDINQELKYVIYIIEDGLVFQQANASTLYGNNSGSARWEMNFVHNQVVRATNNFLGDPIAEGEAVTTNELKVSADLTYTVKNLENVSVVVAVLGEDGSVLNAQKSKANTTQDYEKL